MSEGKKGKWYELTLSVREVSESEVPEGIRTKSTTRAYSDGWDAIWGDKKKEETKELN